MSYPIGTQRQLFLMNQELGNIDRHLTNALLSVKQIEYIRDITIQEKQKMIKKIIYQQYRCLPDDILARYYHRVEKYFTNNEGYPFWSWSPGVDIFDNSTIDKRPLISSDNLSAVLPTEIEKDAFFSIYGYNMKIPKKTHRK